MNEMANGRESSSRAISVLVVVAAILLVNATVIMGLFKTWYVSYAETGHGFIAPVLACYVVWLKKETFQVLPIQGSRAGLLLFAVSSLVVVLSYFSQWVFFGQLALGLLLVGAIWYLLGWNWLRELQFALFLLFLTIPPPAFLYTRLTFELQLLASRIADTGLTLLGYSVLREGNVLHMVGETLSVAEACSGIRSLVTLQFFVIVYGYFVVEKPLHRWILAVSAIPIAVFANGLRIIATGVLAQYNRELAHGITHEVAGYITLLAGGMTCILLEKLIAFRRDETPRIAS
jgi:exosortase